MKKKDLTLGGEYAFCNDVDPFEKHAHVDRVTVIDLGEWVERDTWTQRRQTEPAQYGVADGTTVLSKEFHPALNSRNAKRVLVWSTTSLHRVPTDTTGKVAAALPRQLVLPWAEYVEERDRRTAMEDEAKQRFLAAAAERARDIARVEDTLGFEVTPNGSSGRRVTVNLDDLLRLIDRL